MGEALLTGGGTSMLFDPAAKTWHAVETMLHARVEHSATLLVDGRVMVIGGYKAGTSELEPEAEQHSF